MSMSSFTVDISSKLDGGGEIVVHGSEDGATVTLLGTDGASIFARWDVPYWVANRFAWFIELGGVSEIDMIFDDRATNEQRVTIVELMLAVSTYIAEIAHGTQEPIERVL